MEKYSWDILHATDELRKMILENPDLPLLIDVDEEVKGCVATSVSVRIGEVLDCDQKIDEECTFTDRIYFEERVGDYYYDEWCDMSDAESDKYIAEKVAEYEPYWKKCIIVYVGV